MKGANILCERKNEKEKNAKNRKAGRGSNDSKSQEIHTNPARLKRVLSGHKTMGMGNFSRATVNAKPDKNQQQLLCKQLNCHADRKTEQQTAKQTAMQTAMQRQAQAGVDSSSGEQGAVCCARPGTYARPGDARQIVAHSCTHTHTETGTCNRHSYTDRHAHCDRCRCRHSSVENKTQS